MFYLFLFLTSSLLISLSEYFNNKKYKSQSFFFAFISILILSIFAGIRDTSVGTDVEYYVVKHYFWALNYIDQPFEFILFLNSYDEVEFLYSMIVYIGGFFENLNLILFILSFITNVFIYLGLSLERKNISLALGWMIYCLLFYNYSLNIVRQACALSITFYIFSLILNNKISIHKLLILSLIAIGFHWSSIAIIFLFYLIAFCNNKNHTTILIFICLSICFLPFLFKIISIIISNLTFLPQKYSMYFLTINSTQSVTLLNAIIYFLPFLIYLLFYKYKKLKKGYEILLFFSFFCVLQCLSTNLIFSRLSYYFIIFFAISVPYSANLFSTKNNGRIIFSIMMIIWFSILWYIDVIYYCYGQTYPYKTIF